MNQSRLFNSGNAPRSLRYFCRRWLGVVVAPLLLAALGVAPAFAGLKDSLFELDGNAKEDVGVLGDDWDTLNVMTASTVRRSTGIIADTVPAVFRSGSKDTEDISNWRYDLGSSPPKDDIVHAYAVAYTATETANAGDLLIYFGADRKAFSGTASLGFWFFKQQITRSDSTRGFVNAATNTQATHTEGDTLVAFEYTNGGGVSEVRVYTWHNNALVLKTSFGLKATNTPGVYCDAETNEKICGSTNSSRINLATSEAVEAGQFFEGGINITKLVGLDNCFASFMATSRSSDTTNASVKNFILGSFPVCRLSVTKSCDTSEYQASNDTILFTVKGAVINDGGGPLTNISLVDNPAFNAGSLQYYTCDAGGQPTTTLTTLPASLAVGASVCYRGKYTSTTLTKYDEITATATAGSSTVSGTANATCTGTAPSTGLSITKTCDLDLVQQSGQLGVKVNFGGSVTNEGDVALKNVSVCESHEGSSSCNVTVTVGDLAPKEVKTYSGYYLPSLALNSAGTSTLTEPKNAVFKDVAKATGTPPAIFGTVTVASPSVEATCTLCAP